MTAHLFKPILAVIAVCYIVLFGWAIAFNYTLSAVIAALGFSLCAIGYHLVDRDETTSSRNHHA